MVEHSALGVRSTSARILAALLTAGELLRALRINGAFRSRALSERIARVTRMAVARCMMAVIVSAFRVAAALNLCARWHALTIDASIAGRTVRIGATADLKAGTQRVTSKAIAAHAQRPVQLDVTLGVGGTSVAFGARIAALLLDARTIVRAVFVARTLGLRQLLGLLRGFLVALRLALDVR